MSRPSTRQLTPQTRIAIAARLAGRTEEIEDVIRTRVVSISGAGLEEDDEYLQGMREAISAAIGFGLASIEHGSERCGPVPQAVLAQARYAARRRVGLQVVLRRYAAGYTALSDFLMQEMSGAGPLATPAELYFLQRELTALLDRLLDAVSSGHEDESRHVPSAERDAGRIRRLLAGDFVDTGAFDYDFDGWHVGAIAEGPYAERLLREAGTGHLARRFLMSVEADARIAWAWFGSREGFDQGQIGQIAAGTPPSHTSLALGEPAQGLGGFRRTHRQARTALGAARRQTRGFARYGEVALLSAALNDPDLAAFLTESFLLPLEADRDGGSTLRTTLRAFFSSGRNVSSAAASLSVSRHTVANRIRLVERLIGRALDGCAPELETALRMSDPKCPADSEPPARPI